jgi:hypothetical protein
MKPNTATTESAISQSKPKPSRKWADPPVREGAVWEPIIDGWRRIYGGFYDTGVSIEWQDFDLPDAFEWSRSFHPESLELCLNLAGLGSIRSAERSIDLVPSTAALYAPGKKGLQAWRDPHQQHRFITLEFSHRFLREHLDSCDGALHPLVERFVGGETQAAGLGEVHSVDFQIDFHGFRAKRKLPGLAKFTPLIFR